MMKNPWTTLTEYIPYENPWIKISHREVLNPAGKPGIYGVVHFKNLAIGIVPVDEEGNTWLVGQYRYALDQYSWEIPEGGCPLGTDALETAKRELKEETGMSALEWHFLLDFHNSNSVSDEYGIAYLAKGLSQGEAEPEETEDLQVKKLPLREAIDMVLRGEITDALSVMALLRVEVMIARGEI
jgi:8-oxo-dGTP pyrophosphatase MutT (NUDIX family)